MENILTFVWAEQSIQCAVTQHSRAVGCHHMCPALTDNHLVNPTIKPSFGYPVGSVTKNWVSCQQNQPFKEDVCCCLSWLSVIVPALAQSKGPFLTHQCCAELCVDHQTVADWSQFCSKAMSYFILRCSLQLFLWWLGGGGKDVEIAASANQSVIESVCA